LKRYRESDNARFNSAGLDEGTRVAAVYEMCYRRVRIGIEHCDRFKAHFSLSRAYPVSWPRLHPTIYPEYETGIVDQNSTRDIITGRLRNRRCSRMDVRKDCCSLCIPSVQKNLSTFRALSVLN
jgi:hypothetical protein